ncbi:MAG: molybdate ABC transporter substrate-binding protein [Chloroflexota bacterium]
MYVILAVVLLLAACSSNSRPSLLIFAASSLTDALPAVGAAFAAQEPGVSLDYNFAGSSTLAIQITEGAPADVFLSANPAQMAVVQQAGRVTGEPVVFTGNRLVVAIPADNPAAIATIDDLAADQLMLITAAEGVPVRTYTDAVIEGLAAGGFDAAGYHASIDSEETNVRQVVSKLALGEADAAIVYQSDVTPQNRDRVTALDIIPAEVNVTATYPAAAIDGSNTELAQRYIDFLTTDTAQAIFAEWGFIGAAG